MTYSALAIPRLTSSDTSASAISQTSTAVNILTNCAAPLKGLSAAHMATLRPARRRICRLVSWAFLLACRSGAAAEIVNVSRIFRVLGLHSVIKTLSIDSGYHILWWLVGQAPRLLRMLMRSSREPRLTAMGSSNVSTPRDCSLGSMPHRHRRKLDEPSRGGHLVADGTRLVALLTGVEPGTKTPEHSLANRRLSQNRHNANFPDVGLERRASKVIRTKWARGEPLCYD
jgi:hypothetical protein